MPNDEQQSEHASSRTSEPEPILSPEKVDEIRSLTQAVRRHMDRIKSVGSLALDPLPVEERQSSSFLIKG